MNALKMLMLSFLLVLTSALQARAGCCELAKTDVEIPPTPIRVCEPREDGQCLTVLFAGLIQLQESQQICSSSETIQYHEYDDLTSDYGPPVYAVCDGGDVEF